MYFEHASDTENTWIPAVHCILNWKKFYLKSLVLKNTHLTIFFWNTAFISLSAVPRKPQSFISNEQFLDLLGTCFLYALS